MTRAAESTHWYTREGEPLYTVEKVNGGRRSTTLRDARKLDLVPSVTTILNVVAKPGLVAWKINQMMLAALTLEEKEGESLDDFAQRIRIDADEHGRVARERGTAIHASLEAYFSHDFPDIDHLELCQGTEAALNECFGKRKWKAEESFSHSLGFGGKVDLNCPSIVADFKVKEFDETAKAQDFAYPEMALQLAAYRCGLGLPKAQLVNVFVSATHPGLALIHIWDEGRWIDMFNHLLAYWQLSKNYDSSYPQNFLNKVSA